MFLRAVCPRTVLLVVTATIIVMHCVPGVTAAAQSTNAKPAVHMAYQNGTLHVDKVCLFNFECMVRVCGHACIIAHRVCMCHKPD